MGDPLILNQDKLPIRYEIEKESDINNPFFTRFGHFDKMEDELIDVFDSNLTFAVYNLMKWKGKPMELAPFQSVILQVLWEKTFPIMLASRGAGKCIRDALICTSNGFENINDVCESNKFGDTPKNINILGENSFNKTTFTWKNPPEKIYKLTTQDGYEIKGVGKHQIRIIEDGQIIWKKLEDFDGSEYIVICRDIFDFNGKYKIDKDEAYLLGAIIGDGCLTTPGRIGFTNTNKDIIAQFTNNHKKLKFCTNFISHKSDEIEFSILFGSNDNKNKFLNYYLMKEGLAQTKVIPATILQSNKESLSNFISGYADTDGGVTERGVEFSSVSETLLRQLQIILLSYGIISKRRKKMVKYNGDRRPAWVLLINKDNCHIFQAKIGFRCYNKQQKLAVILKNHKSNPNKDLLINCDNLLNNLLVKQKQINNKSIKRLNKTSINIYDFSYSTIDNILCNNDCKDAYEYKQLQKLSKRKFYYDKIQLIEHLAPDITYDVHIPNDHTFISNGMISHNTFMLAIYALLRAILVQGSRVVIVAASFRQSKLVFDYIIKIHDESPLVQEATSRIVKQNDSWEMTIGSSTIKALPLGNGDKIRGIRASDIICDEFASIPEEIFQVVVRGFAAVASDPVDAAKLINLENEKIRKGEMKEEERKRKSGNKIIYTGTANFRFNHFWKLYCIHKDIIEKKFIGDGSELNKSFKDEILKDGTVTGNIDYRDYAIIQLPYTALPEGFMDDKQISQARATMPRALFSMEYECMFPNDSDGFFKRSIINEATPGYSGGDDAFGVELAGLGEFEYVMGVDPARRTDNFAISILKIMNDGTFRNVYCSSMNNKNWVEAVKRIRDLLKKFKIVRMAVDSAGGGTTVEDLLQDRDLAGAGDSLIWRHDDPEHIKFEGQHIMEMVNFTPSWIAEANYGLASDIEHKRIQFPFRNTSVNTNESTEPTWDEIEEQINEVCMITVSSTKTGVQHFDLPNNGIENTLNTVQRKDRYSALLLAAYAARTYMSQGKKIVMPEPGDWLDYI